MDVEDEGHFALSVDDLLDILREARNLFYKPNDIEYFYIDWPSRTQERSRGETAGQDSPWRVIN
jgi:hypothetical protein